LIVSVWKEKTNLKKQHHVKMNSRCGVEKGSSAANGGFEGALMHRRADEAKSRMTHKMCPGAGVLLSKTMMFNMDESTLYCVEISDVHGANSADALRRNLVGGLREVFILIILVDRAGLETFSIALPVLKTIVLRGNKES
jgi:hypothetical protein